MARQKGIIKLKGTIGDITYYKTSQDGHLAREKGGIEKSRIQSDVVILRLSGTFQRSGRFGLQLVDTRGSTVDPRGVQSGERVPVALHLADDLVGEARAHRGITAFLCS